MYGGCDGDSDPVGVRTLCIDGGILCHTALPYDI